MNASVYPQQQSTPGAHLRGGPPLPLEVWGATDKGREREGNEDAVYPLSGVDTGFVPKPGRVAQRGRIFVVADGVGGGTAGAEASRWAVRVAVERYYDLSGPDLGADLRAAIEATNASLYQYLQSTGAGNAGSTMAAALIHDNVLYIANVGDSRVYLLRDGKAYCQTRDHTLTEEKLAKGLIDAERAQTDPDRNVLTRSLGAGPTVLVDLFPPQPLQPGDIVLLCSDGLTDMVPEEEIVRLVSNRSPKRAAQRLIAAANRRGGFDNISVIVVRVGGAPPAGGSAAPRAAEGPFARAMSDLRRLSAKQKAILVSGAALVALTFCLLAALVIATLGKPPQTAPTATPAAMPSPTTSTVEVVAPATPTLTSPTPARATSTPVPTPTSTPTPRPVVPTSTSPPPTSEPGQPAETPGGGGGGEQPTPLPPTTEVPTEKPSPPPPSP